MSDANEVTTVLVPVRDFAKGLQRFLEGWREAFKQLGRQPRFIVVDDGSSEPIVAKNESDLTVIHQQTAQGLGAAIRNLQFGLGLTPSLLGEGRGGGNTSQLPEGATPHPNPPPQGGSEQETTRTELLHQQFEENTYAILIIVPEFGYRPSDLRSIFDAFKEVDMVIGVRPGQPMPWLLNRIKRRFRFVRRWLFGIPATDFMPWYGWAAAKTRLRYRFVYGPRLQDPGTGLLLVRRSILEQCPIQSDGSFAILELIAKANFLGAMMAEVLLTKPNDMPVMKGRFESSRIDERTVFRRPTFLAAKSTTGTDETSSIPVATP